MIFKLRTKLSLTYIMVVIITLILVFIFLRELIDKQFIVFVKDMNADRRNNIVQSLEHQYHYNEAWNMNKLKLISEDAVANGIVIVVKDKEAKVVWDTEKSLGRTDKKILEPIEKNTTSASKHWNGNLTHNQVVIRHGMENVGSVVMTYYEPFYFTERDMNFIKMLNKIISYTLIVSLLAALIIGTWVSRQISIPISKAAKITKDISRGNLNNKIDLKSNTYEIRELAEAVNLLGENLKSQEKIRKRIVSDISHELRTPLTAIQGHIEALIDGIWEPSRERLTNIYKEILRINRLIGGLSKLTKYESGSDRLNLTNFNLTEVIERIITDFQTEFHKKNLEIKVDSKVNNIYGDEDKLTQVIVNIISNSIKYSRDNGLIELRTYREGKNIFIKVKDNGIGIPKEDIPHIFERFYRVDKSRSRDTGGSGIGLTITKTIVEAHNGKISVNSELGKGTEITIQIPVV